MREHRLGTAHVTDLGIGGFDVEHGWQVALAEEGVLDEVLGLGGLVGAGAEDVGDVDVAEFRRRLIDRLEVGLGVGIHVCRGDARVV